MLLPGADAEDYAVNAERHRQRAQMHLRAGHPDYATRSLQKAERNRYQAAFHAQREWKAFGPDTLLQQITKTAVARWQKDMLKTLLEGGPSVPNSISNVDFR